MSDRAIVQSQDAPLDPFEEQQMFREAVYVFDTRPSRRSSKRARRLTPEPEPPEEWFTFDNLPTLDDDYYSSLGEEHVPEVPAWRRLSGTSKPDILLETTSTQTPPCRCAATQGLHEYNTRKRPTEPPSTLHRECSCPSWEEVQQEAREVVTTRSKLKRVRDTHRRRYARERERMEKIYAWPVPANTKRRNKFQIINDKLATLGFQYEKGVGSCARAGILNGHIKFETEADLDQVVYTNEEEVGLMLCPHRVTATLRDLLLQTEPTGDYSQRGAVYCDALKSHGNSETACCEGTFFVTGMCKGKFVLNRGDMETVHCSRCFGFGACERIRDDAGTLEHCDICGFHYPSPMEVCENICNPQNIPDAILNPICAMMALKSGCSDEIPCMKNTIWSIST